LGALERAEMELLQRVEEVEEAYEAIGGHTSNAWKEVCLIARSMEAVATIFGRTATFGNEPHTVDYATLLGLSKLKCQ
jgi:hypothetical protein